MPESRQYARLFQAKVLTLLATGIASVELSVIAVNIAGPDASALLGTALAMKALCFVVAPLLMAAVVEHLPRGRSLIAIDLLRAAAVLGLIFVSSELSFLAVIAVFLAASAAFKVTYLEYVAHLVPDRDEFATAMSKSRIVDELEGAISPLLAAALLFLLPMDLFLVLTALAFVVSALRTGMARLPDLGRSGADYHWRRSFAGIARFHSDATLRPVTWLMVAVAAGTAMVMTNTPALVEAAGDFEASAIALAFGAFGVGAVVGAIAVVWLGRHLSERATMLAGAILITTGLFGGIPQLGFVVLVLLWFLIGAGVTLVQTPAAAIIRRSAGEHGLLTLYGAGWSVQSLILVFGFALAGWLAAQSGASTAFLVLAALSAGATTIAWRVWRTGGPDGELNGIAEEYRVLWSWIQTKQLHRRTGPEDG